MALASQTIAAANRNRYMSSSRRRRRSGRLLGALFLIALIAGAAWAVMHFIDGDGADSGQGDRTGAAASDRDRATAVKEEEPTRSDRSVRSDEDRGAATTQSLNEKWLASQQSSTAPSGASDGSTMAKESPSPLPDGSAIATSTAVIDPAPVSTPPADETSRPAIPASGASSELARALALATTDPIESRRMLTRSLDGTELVQSDRLRAYEGINEVNAPLFFRSGIVQGDTVFRAHKVEEGDSPTAIVRKLNADCESDLLVRINGVRDARRIRVGQVLKVPVGAFHAEVRKSEFRLNLYHGEGADRVMIASYPVGLGESNTTPTGIFKVRPKSKLKNPQWTNPRTGEFFASDDPRNPIGERWIGIEGVEPHNRDFLAYGIHGTIEPDSIGRMMSMGCIRMRAEDVEVVYETLTVPHSTILIAP